MHYPVGVLSFNDVIDFSFISVRLLILKKKPTDFYSFFFNKSIIPYFFVYNLSYDQWYTRFCI